MLVAEHLILIKMGLPKRTGTFPMELEFPAMVKSGISTDPEIRWWYVWTANKVERMGSIAVRSLIQWMLTRKYTLECTQQAGVSDIVCTLLFVSTLLQCLHVFQKSGSHIANKPDYSLSSVLYRVSIALYAWKRCYEILTVACGYHEVVCTQRLVWHKSVPPTGREREGNRGSLPQALSARGPPNSALRFMLLTQTSDTYYYMVPPHTIHIAGPTFCFCPGPSQSSWQPWL